MRLTKGQNAAFGGASAQVTCSWRRSADADADLSALLLSGGKVRSDADFVFYNQPSSIEGSVQHRGKTTAAAATTIDALTADLDQLPAEVDSVVFAVSFDGPPSASLQVLTPISVQAADPAGTVWDFVIEDLTTETALVTLELYRRDNGWKVRAVGQGYADGLAGLARDFGVTVDDEPAPTDEPPTPQPVGPPDPPAVVGPQPVDWRNPPVPAGYELRGA